MRGIKNDEILENSTLMLLDKNNMSRKYIDDYFQDNQITIADSIDISNMDLLIDFAKIGVGIACVIKSFVSKELEEGCLVEIPLSIPIHQREVGFAYKDNIKPSKSLETFINFYNCIMFIWNKNNSTHTTSKLNMMISKKIIVRDT